MKILVKQFFILYQKQTSLLPLSLDDIQPHPHTHHHIATTALRPPLNAEEPPPPPPSGGGATTGSGGGGIFTASSGGGFHGGGGGGVHRRQKERQREIGERERGQGRAEGSAAVSGGGPGLLPTSSLACFDLV
ncbi:hypothetical protein HanIR_Chr13g0616591 [Helianthus annuus]|nr:hypothetical protein HanIR_Chr13g0616591 [Helianthus annuus]